MQITFHCIERKARMDQFECSSTRCVDHVSSETSTSFWGLRLHQVVRLVKWEGVKEIGRVRISKHMIKSGLPANKLNIHHRDTGAEGKSSASGKSSPPGHCTTLAPMECGLLYDYFVLKMNKINQIIHKSNI